MPEPNYVSPSLDDIAAMTHQPPAPNPVPPIVNPIVDTGKQFWNRGLTGLAADAGYVPQGVSNNSFSNILHSQAAQDALQFTGGGLGMVKPAASMFGHPELDAEFAKMDPAAQELAKAWVNKKPGSGDAEKILQKVFKGGLSDKLIDQWDSFTDKWSEHQEIESALEVLKDYNTGGAGVITPYELSNAFETLQVGAKKMSPMQQTKFWQSYENIEPGNLPPNHGKAADAIQDASHPGVLDKKWMPPEPAMPTFKATFPKPPGPTLDLQSNEKMAETKNKWAAAASDKHAEWEKIQQLLKDPSKLTQEEYDAALDAEERLMGHHEIHPDTFIPHFKPLDWSSKSSNPVNFLSPESQEVAKQKGLDKRYFPSKEVREKAKQQGYNPDFPLYKGASDKGYWETLPDPITKPNERATFFSDQAKIAGFYGSVEPYVARAEMPMTIDWRAATGLHSYSSAHMRPMLDAARKMGVDMLEIKNIEDLGGEQTQYAVLHPRILRAPGANFDPAMMQHAMPLAGLAGGVIFLDQYGNVIPQRKDQ